MTITLDRPERRNALTTAMYDEMSGALADAADDRDILVIRFRGSNGTFTAGNDLGDFMQNPPTGPDSPVFRFMRALCDAEKPVVAEVDGWAVGIGTTMLLHCDLVVLSERATLKMPFVDLAVVPEYASSVLLPRLAGHARAAEWLLLGEAIPPQVAVDVGLATRVVPVDQLADTTDAMCTTLCAKAPQALRLSKQLMKAPMRDTIEAALDAEGAVFVERLNSPEAREVFQAFFEKRPPDFRPFR
jgi:enoyl-CoA hydratase/carnithine racemase